MNIHFIAIGGSAMHNLAIALSKKGVTVTGSDDEIFEPSRSRLKKYNLLPPSEGWDESRISPTLDAIVLGMHAKEDNPELLRAKKLGLRIFSYPEYLFEHARNKTRVVIGGSHGKTTITSMILHVLQHYNISCDYMVGAQLEGFDVMVKMTDDAPVMILEGDEYLTSPIDRRPKFHLYKPHIGLISGIAWDHINVFPTFEIYVKQFRIFADEVEPQGTLVYFEGDEVVRQIGESARKDILTLPYGLPAHKVEHGVTSLLSDGKKYPLKIFGDHNLSNLNGARQVCGRLGVDDKQFFEAIQSFKGASRRLQVVAENANTAVFKDFAHSPSKLVATTQAVKRQFPDRQLVACIELHTYSSLSEKFLDHYAGCLDEADIAKVYFSPHALKLKRLPEITEEQVKKAFQNPDLDVYTTPEALKADLDQIAWKDKNLLMMSSGNFDGIVIEELGKAITGIA